MPSFIAARSRGLDFFVPGGWNGAGVSPTCSYPFDKPKRLDIVTAGRRRFE
jgi:hypothetical protein